MFDPTNEGETGLVCLLQPHLGHCNSVPLSRLWDSMPFSSPSFSAPAKWEEDPLTACSMFPLTIAIKFGSLKFRMKSSLSIFVILSWLNKCVSTMLTYRFEMLRWASRGGDPRVSVDFDGVLFAVYVHLGDVTEGLNSQLWSSYRYRACGV